MLIERNQELFLTEFSNHFYYILLINSWNFRTGRKMYSLSPKLLNLQMKAMKLNALLKITTSSRQSPDNCTADSALPTTASCLFTPVYCRLLLKYDTRIFSSIVSYTLRSWWGKPLSGKLNFIFKPLSGFLYFILKRHLGIAAPNNLY